MNPPICINEFKKGRGILGKKSVDYLFVSLVLPKISYGLSVYKKINDYVLRG
jgi:hypothetical protein